MSTHENETVETVETEEIEFPEELRTDNGTALYRIQEPMSHDLRELKGLDWMALRYYAMEVFAPDADEAEEYGMHWEDFDDHNAFSCDALCLGDFEGVWIEGDLIASSIVMNVFNVPNVIVENIETGNTAFYVAAVA